MDALSATPYVVRPAQDVGQGRPRDRSTDRAVVDGKEVAFYVAFGGKADMAHCSANVRL